jgi:hypothetical protein
MLKIRLNRRLLVFRLLRKFRRFRQWELRDYWLDIHMKRHKVFGPTWLQFALPRKKRSQALSPGLGLLP